MSLLINMIPLYLSGNFHCFGMCGPIAMLMSTKKSSWLYLFGRLISFSLFGFLCGLLGCVFSFHFKDYFISAALSLFLGVFSPFQEGLFFLDVLFLALNFGIGCFFNRLIA